MPTYVDPQACDACAGVHQGPLCVYICPNDLMLLRPDIGKGFNQEPEMCSECYACVKLCPQDAIHVRGYADFVPLGAMVQPKRVEQGLRWTVRFRDGRELHFTYPSRSTPVGSSEPYRGLLKIRSVICRARHWRGSRSGWVLTGCQRCRVRWPARLQPLGRGAG